jgi:histidinol-phosphate phosphatase family protein
MYQKIKQAVIFAGGMGTRLRPLTNDRPKPMVLVNGRPFLEYLIELLRSNGITDVVLLLGYLPEKVVEHFGDGRKFGMNIRYSISDVSDETGVRLKKAEALLDDLFLLMYSDNYWPVDLEKIVVVHAASGKLGLMSVYNNRDHASEYGTRNNVRVEEDGRVSYYGAVSDDPRINATDAGVFLMSKKVVDLIPDGNVSFQTTVLPKLISENQLAAYRMDHPYYFVTSPDCLPLVEKFFVPKKVIFLDRDGVINKKAFGNERESDYIKSWREFEFLPGAKDALALLTGAGYKIFIVSNQRGIARGMMTAADLKDLHYRMEGELNRHGAWLAGSYYCPHDYADNCFCRKPRPGLLYRAAREHYLDLTKAIVVGDGKNDVEAGQAAGCKTILIKEGELLAVVQSLI